MPTEQAVLAERYTLDRVIGRGGMADVYLATDVVLEREVAVKVLRTQTASDRDRARFTSEARTLASLDHPNLVSVLDAGIHDATPYLVMDLVEGRSLSTACADGPLPERQVARIGAVLCDALAYVHDRAVVHRDLKPGNVLLGDNGQIRLADFGIARLLGDTGHTATGTLVGTAAYLAPEQVQGDPVSTASDVYSLGLLLLEALTGVRAYTGTPTEAALARLHTPPPIPESMSPGWQRVLRAMTALDPAHRPTARDAGRALRRLAEPGGSRSVDVTIPVQEHAAPSADAADDAPYVDSPPVAAPRRHRRRWVAVGVAVAAAVLAVVGAGALGLGNDAPTASASTTVKLPSGVPPRLQSALADVHRAVGDSPVLTGALGRVDGAVVAGHWPAARRLLDVLVRTTIDSRDVGNLTSEQADEIQASAARLAAELPGADSRP